ncbi:hypothetical protein [Spiroplasma kunkelii]|nr:hypothetical protein [Spiroplasma kunkelii]
MRNGKDVLPENVTQQNYKFPEKLLLKKFSDIKPNAVDQYSNTL